MMWPLLRFRNSLMDGSHLYELDLVRCRKSAAKNSFLSFSALGPKRRLSGGGLAMMARVELLVMEEVDQERRA